MSKTSYWSIGDHKETVARLYLKGMSANQVAVELARLFPNHPGPTRNAVIGLVHRLGLSRDGHLEAQLRAAVRARSSAPKPPAPKPTRATIEARAKAIKPEPIPMSKPVLLSGQEKVWTERAFGECNWIVAGSGADAIACCAKVHRIGWCAKHYKRGTLKPEPAPRRKRTVREPTFYDVEAA